MLLHSALSFAVLNLVDIDWEFASFTIRQVVLQSLGSSALLCVFGSRMFFNLKEEGEKNFVVDTDWPSNSQTLNANLPIMFGDSSDSSAPRDRRRAFPFSKRPSEYLTQFQLIFSVRYVKEE